MQQDSNSLNLQTALDPGAAIAAENGFKRSPQWHEVELAFLNANNHRCAACGITGEGLIQVHHIAPFHYVLFFQRQDLEFNPNNLIPLCQGPGTNDHHELIGHLGDFQYFNQTVKTDLIGPWKDMAAAIIKQQQDWIARNKDHYPLLAAMTPDDKNTFIALLEQWYGPKPQQSIDVLLEQWYGLKPRPSGSTGA